ncbi:MAG: hypothetical protein EA379_05830 [Phycisphaerales bacterium]|nr:MAG: hypothetical protein EA379_05830 [Phycisphaerales bacterium]
MRWALIAIGLAAGVAAAWVVARPRVDPPVSGRIVNTVTSFWRDHPEWEVLREGRYDATPILLNHARHMDPDAPGMQAYLADLVKDPRAHVQRLPDGRLSMSCASCHVQDSAGRNMRPIRFDTHCIACHSDDLGSVEIDPRGERMPVPHGSVAHVVERIDGALALWALRARAESPDADDAAEPEEDTGRRRRRAGPSEAPRAEAVPAFASGAEADAWIAERRDRALRRVETSCAKCHVGIEPVPDASPGEPFRIEPPRIPDRWLTRAVFSHHSHTMLSCVACHIDAPTSVSTRDILLPGIMSCRECHSPSAGAPSSCVLCHTYHDRSLDVQGGELTIPEFLRPRGAQ